MGCPHVLGAVSARCRLPRTAAGGVELTR
jgi:hypothetical protein